MGRWQCLVSYIRWLHEHIEAQCSPVSYPAFGSRKDWRQKTACRFEDISGDFRSCKSRIFEDSYAEKRASTKCLIHVRVHGECLMLARPKAASERSCMLTSMKAFVLLSNCRFDIRSKWNSAGIAMAVSAVTFPPSPRPIRRPSETWNCSQPSLQLSNARVSESVSTQRYKYVARVQLAHRPQPAAIRK